MILLLLGVNVFALDLMTLYRYEGINSVEKELENRLKDIDYWKEYFKDKNVDYGYYEFKKYILVAQKEQLEINAYKLLNNRLNIIFWNMEVQLIIRIDGNRIKGDGKFKDLATSVTINIQF